MGSRVLIKE